MKLLATSLLALAALIYVVTLHRDGWLGFVNTAAEAAMVGAIADWFAVTALFRHPLGIPIPHTAIIPSNKDRIGENLAAFICANFLSTQQVLARIEGFGAARRLANWLADPRHAEQVATHLGTAVHYALGALDDPRVRDFFGRTVLDRLEQADLA